MVSKHFSPEWKADYLPHFVTTEIPLGEDPDGEGDICAYLTHYEGKNTGGDGPGSATKPAILYTHGLNDYFFQTELAEFFDRHNFHFYALDLRKCGRAQRPGQSPHMVTDLRVYDKELNAALEIIRQRGHREWMGMAHSTGGLVLLLWVQRMQQDPAWWNPSGLIMNSPWWDLTQGAFLRSMPGYLVLKTLGGLFPWTDIPGQGGDTYGRTLHVSRDGEWDYRTEWKRLESVPKKFGWFSQIRSFQLKLHKGPALDTPLLVLSSDRSGADPDNPERDHTADVVLDVEHMAQWASAVSKQSEVHQIPDAKHDVFLSIQPAREKAYQTLSQWLYDQGHNLHH
ncbi:MAG: alpha/beta hydrolase [Lawsonella sp.]